MIGPVVSLVASIHSSEALDGGTVGVGGAQRLWPESPRRPTPKIGWVASHLLSPVL